MSCNIQKFPSHIKYLRTSSVVDSLRGVHLSHLKKKKDFCPCHESDCAAWSRKSTDVEGRNYQTCEVVVLVKLHGGNSGFDR